MIHINNDHVTVEHVQPDVTLARKNKMTDTEGI